MLLLNIYDTIYCIVLNEIVYFDIISKVHPSKNLFDPILYLAPSQFNTTYIIVHRNVLTSRADVWKTCESIILLILYYSLLMFPVFSVCPGVNRL